MKKDVWLTISSQQQFAGCDEENIDLQTAATLFAEDERHVGLYQTPVGSEMAIATHTSRVHNTIGEDGGHLIIDYTVEVDNSLMGEHHFEMTVSTKPNIQVV